MDRALNFSASWRSTWTPGQPPTTYSPTAQNVLRIQSAAEPFQPLSMPSALKSTSGNRGTSSSPGMATP